MARAGAPAPPSWLAEVDSLWLEDFAPAVREHVLTELNNKESPWKLMEDAAATLIPDWTHPLQASDTRDTWLYVIDMLAAYVDLFNKPHTAWPVQIHLLHVVCFHDSLNDPDLERLAWLVEAGTVLRGNETNEVLKAAPVAEVIAQLHRAAGDLACLLRLRALLLRACGGGVASLEDLQDAIDRVCEAFRRDHARAEVGAVTTSAMRDTGQQALQTFVQQVRRITWQSDGPGLGSQGMVDPMPPAECTRAAFEAAESSFPSLLLQHAAKEVSHLVATARHEISPQIYAEPMAA